jgi:prevent-host-death family protein
MPRKPRARPHFNIAEAKAHFSELVEKALLGEEVIIAKDNRPILRLVPLSGDRGPRTSGTAKGRVWTAADFDAPLEDFSDD